MDFIKSNIYAYAWRPKSYNKREREQYLHLLLGNMECTWYAICLSYPDKKAYK